MKHIARIILCAAILAFAGCTKDAPVDDFGRDGSVSGEWRLESWNGSSYVSVYLSFDTDGGFDVYQRAYTPYYEHLDGTYKQSADKLEGTYSDGEPWHGAPYSISFSADGNRMRMISGKSSSDVSVYIKSAIPVDVKSGEPGVKSLPAGRNGVSSRFL